jgi:hypothetical protein
MSSKYQNSPQPNLNVIISLIVRENYGRSAKQQK